MDSQSLKLEIIYSNDDALEWATYFYATLNQLIDKLDIKFISTFEIVSGYIRNNNENNIPIILISPEFLHFLMTATSKMLSIFNFQQAAAIFLGTESDETLHLLQKLPYFDSWIKENAKEDSNEMQQILEKILNDITKFGKQSMYCEYYPKVLYELIPDEITEETKKITVLLKEPVNFDDKIIVTLSNWKKSREIIILPKWCNPYTLQFKTPEIKGRNCLLSVNITCNDRSMGIQRLEFKSLLNKVGEYLTKTVQPIKFLCQALDLTSLDECDNALSQIFLRTKPQHFELLSPKKESESYTKEEFPTLLHFAVHYGFRELCSQLLECPGAREACEIENYSHQTPINIAESNDYLDIAEMLQNFYEFDLIRGAKFYDIWKRNKDSFKKAKHYAEGDGYEQMLTDEKIFTERYANVEIEDITRDGYLKMEKSHPNSDLYPYSCTEECRNIMPIRRASEPHIPSYSTLKSKSWESADDLMPNIMEVENNFSLIYSPSNHLSSDDSQQELIELLNLFKKEEYTLNEVELLFRSWKQRNADDSTKTFKQKREHLNKMRESYERLKTTLEKEQKDVSLLDRLFMLVKKKPKKEPKVISPPNVNYLPKCFRVLGVKSCQELMDDSYKKNETHSIIHIVSPMESFSVHKIRESTSSSSSFGSELTFDEHFDGLTLKEENRNSGPPLPPRNFLPKMPANRPPAPPPKPENLSTKKKFNSSPKQDHLFKANEYI